VAIQGLDTRMLTRMIRTQGAMRGILSTKDLEDTSLLQRVMNSPFMAGRNLAGGGLMQSTLQLGCTGRNSVRASCACARD